MKASSVNGTRGNGTVAICQRATRRELSPKTIRLQLINHFSDFFRSIDPPIKRMLMFLRNEEMTPITVRRNLITITFPYIVGESQRQEAKQVLRELNPHYQIECKMGTAPKEIIDGLLGRGIYHNGGTATKGKLPSVDERFAMLRKIENDLA